jgi:hypothetical protein
LQKRIDAIAAVVNTLPMPIAEEIVPHIATTSHIEDAMNVFC